MPDSVPPRRSTASVKIHKVRPGSAVARTDRVAGEEPMEIRAAGPGQELVSIAVTMRTPGNDFELAAGFLVTEGLVAAEDIGAISYCDSLEGAIGSAIAGSVAGGVRSPPQGELGRQPAAAAEGQRKRDQNYNVVTVRLKRAIAIGSARNFFATSSCGVCGKASLEAISVRCPPAPPGPVVPLSVLLAVPDRLRRAQRLFDKTGGLHAAGLFDARGDLHVAREDVGRHNAVDKIVGHLVTGGDGPPNPVVLAVSGRLSFEIVQKAAVARIPILVAVSAPSSLAIQTAAAQNMTLVGFTRGEACNVYTGRDRIGVGA